jgi:hypothetical protein
MSCGRAVRPAGGVFAKVSRMNRSKCRGVDVCGGETGGFANMRGECTVAYERLNGRQCGMCPRNGMSHTPHGPELVPPLFTFIHQRVCSPLSLNSHVFPKHIKPRSVLSLSSSPRPSCLLFQPLPQSPPHHPPLRTTFVTSFPLAHLLLRRIRRASASASSRLTLHNT